MQRQLVAAIDVGSHALRMKIGELKKNGEFRELESFRKVAVLGHDTFTQQKVSFDSVDRTCEVLKDFQKIMKDYNVTRYIAMATSAVREAKNRDYIVDQIRLKTGLEIKVISNSEEQYLTHKALKSRMPNYAQIMSEGAVLVVIGAGSIQIATYKDGQLQSSQNVKMGALRIREVLSEIEASTTRYYKILDEFIAVNLEGLEIYASNTEYKHLIAVGGEMSIITELMGRPFHDICENIEKSIFYKFCKDISLMSTEDIRTLYGIKKERAEIIGPSLLLFKQFVDRTTGDDLIVPNITLTDGIIELINEDMNKLNVQDEIVSDIITNARILSDKYNVNKKHSRAVEQYAQMIFDKTKRLHGLKDEKLLLRIACILHDIGKYISLDMHSVHSYSIIHKLEIFGMSEEQMEIIANVAKYHSTGVPSDRDFSFARMSERHRVIIAKLVAIIRIADALDRSHQQKLDIVNIKVVDKEVIIRCETRRNTTLEEWTFKEKSEFFKEVFGISPVLKVKKTI